MTEKDNAKDERRFWIPAVIRCCFADLQKKYDEHYLNMDERIKDDLVNQISDSFIQNPKEYKYKKLLELHFSKERYLRVKL